MIADLRSAVWVYKPKKSETEEPHAVVEYLTQEIAEKAMESTITVKDTVLEKGYGRSGERTATKTSSNYKMKVYLGGLPEDTTDTSLKTVVSSLMSPKNVFVSKSKGAEKEGKYAFLEFSNESERNMALGLLEKVKDEGRLGSKVVISPAYNYSRQQPRLQQRKKA